MMKLRHDIFEEPMHHLNIADTLVCHGHEHNISVTAAQPRALSGPEIHATVGSQVSHRGWSRITANATFSSKVGAPEVADRTWFSDPRPRYRALGRLPGGFPACPSTSAACSRNLQCNGPGHVRFKAAPDLLTAG